MSVQRFAPRLKAQTDIVFREHSKDSPNAILTGKSNIKVGVLLHTNAGGTAGLYIQTFESYVYSFTVSDLIPLIYCL